MLDQWSQAASEAWDVGRVGRLTLSFEVVVFTIQANVVKCMEEKKSINSGSQIVLRRPRSNPNSQCLFKALCRPDSPSLCVATAVPASVLQSISRACRVGESGNRLASDAEEKSSRGKKRKSRNREKGAEKRGRGEGLVNGLMQVWLEGGCKGLEGRGRELALPTTSSRGLQEARS